MSSSSSVLGLLLSLLLPLLMLLLLLGSNRIEARYVPQMPSELPPKNAPYSLINLNSFLFLGICSMPPPYSEGICTIEIEGFYYDPATLDCQMYTVGACRLTPGQSFGSLEDCVNKCVLGVQSRRRSPDYYRNE